MAFTDSKLRSLRSKKERFIVWEPGKTGMGVRVSPTGRKSFVYMYRYQNTARMMTIGTYPQIGLVSARLKAAQAKELLSKGTDPGKLWVEVKAKEREAETIQNLVDEYLEKWAKPRKRSWREDERILNYDVLPVWKTKKAKDVKRRDVIKLLDMIIEREAPIMANRTLAVIRRMFNFALTRDILENTPCAAIPKPSKEEFYNYCDSKEPKEEFYNYCDSKEDFSMDTNSSQNPPNCPSPLNTYDREYRQNPHCNPCSCQNPSCTGSSLPSFSSPSTVATSDPSA